MTKKEGKRRKLQVVSGWIGWIESFVGQIEVSEDTLEKIRLAEVECESDDDHVGLVNRGIMFAITSCQPAILNSL
ncbi:hypothetical protein T11_4900 [Trichinella zimbabwensis]|uniref:Uncharacterized protein n=1 Tax=Trichinella zimbabwensis TaxID=268475 RepID=A0A0V1GZC3_9BILA|nr:hypothetical protein T11_4900 [Trichinella zimbabwensis]